MKKWAIKMAMGSLVLMLILPNAFVYAGETVANADQRYWGHLRDIRLKIIDKLGKYTSSAGRQNIMDNFFDPVKGGNYIQDLEKAYYSYTGPINVYKIEDAFCQAVSSSQKKIKDSMYRESGYNNYFGFRETISLDHAHALMLELTTALMQEYVKMKFVELETEGKATDLLNQTKEEHRKAQRKKEIEHEHASLRLAQTKEEHRKAQRKKEIEHEHASLRLAQTKEEHRKALQKKEREHEYANLRLAQTKEEYRKILQKKEVEYEHASLRLAQTKEEHRKALEEKQTEYEHAVLAQSKELLGHLEEVTNQHQIELQKKKEEHRQILLTVEAENAEKLECLKETHKQTLQIREREWMKQVEQESQKIREANEQALKMREEQLEKEFQKKIEDWQKNAEIEFAEKETEIRRSYIRKMEARDKYLHEKLMEQDRIDEQKWKNALLEIEREYTHSKKEKIKTEYMESLNEEEMIIEGSSKENPLHEELERDKMIKQIEEDHFEAITFYEEKIKQEETTLENSLIEKDESN